MKHQHVKEYIDQQVQEFADSKIRPLTHAIGAEIQGQRAASDNLKRVQAETDKKIKESEERIATLNAELTTAKSDAYELAQKLAGATEEAVTE